MRAGRVPRMPRWLRQPRHGSRAWYCPFTLASGSDPRHESRVALLAAGHLEQRRLEHGVGGSRALELEIEPPRVTAPTDLPEKPRRDPELRGDRLGRDATPLELGDVERAPQVRGEKRSRPDRRLALDEQRAKEPDGASAVAGGEAIGQLVCLMGTRGADDGAHVG